MLQKAETELRVELVRISYWPESTVKKHKQARDFIGKYLIY